MIKGHAKITISRPSCSRGREHISIGIDDADSSCRIIELSIGLAEFTRAITGLGACECSMMFWEDCPVGRKRQVKHEFVQIPEDADGGRYRADREDYDAEIRKAVAEFEVDGWEGRDADAKNWHHYSKGESRKGFKAYKVTYIRFVPQPITGSILRSEEQA